MSQIEIPQPTQREIKTEIIRNTYEYYRDVNKKLLIKIKKNTAETLSTYLNDDDSEIRRVSLQTITTIAEYHPKKMQQLIPLIVERVDDDEINNRISALSALGMFSLHKPKMVEHLRPLFDKLVKSKNKNVQRMAVLAAHSLDVYWIKRYFPLTLPYIPYFKYKWRNYDVIKFITMGSQKKK